MTEKRNNFNKLIEIMDLMNDWNQNMLGDENTNKECLKKLYNLIDKYRKKEDK